MNILDIICKECGHTAGLHGNDIGQMCCGPDPRREVDCRCSVFSDDVIAARLAEAERLLRRFWQDEEMRHEWGKFLPSHVEHAREYFAAAPDGERRTATEIQDTN